MNRDDSFDEAAVIEREIAQTRASLHRKVEELQHRLNPRERVREAGERIGEQVRNAGDRVRHAVEGVDARAYADEYAGAAALGAIAVGTALAVRGLRRRSSSSSDDCIAPSDVDLMGE